MAAGAPVVIPFTADLSAVHTAYAAFLAYVRANPAQVVFGGGGPGQRPAGTPPPLPIGVTILNQPIRVEVINWQAAGVPGQSAAGGPSRTGGRGGGGGGGGGLARHFGAFAILRDLEQVANNEEAYQRSLFEAAGSPLATATAELKHRTSYDSFAFGIGRLGRFTRENILPGNGPTTYEIESQLREASRAEKVNDLREREASEARHAQYRVAEAQAGPPGSYQQQQQRIEDQYRAEQDKVRELKRERLKAIEEEKAAAIQAAQPTGVEGFIYERTGYLSEANKAKVEKAEAAARTQAAAQKSVLDRAFGGSDTAAAAERTAALKELQYRKQQETTRAQAEADVERVKTERKYNVAEADSIFNAGRVRVEAEKHKGNADAATAEVEITRQRLLQLQYRLQFGGDAEATDNLGALDFGQGKEGYVQGDPLKIDDILEAMKEISTKLDELKTL